MPTKPILFISHIAEEKDLALSFKSLVENNFLNLLEVFVSSDKDSIGMGQRWLDNITDSLKSCAVEIVICSPQSVKKPWINFEAGASWVRGIPVIPICHSGIEPSQLPLPLNLLQAAKATEAISLDLVFPVLAEALGARCPTVDLSSFVRDAKEFEINYTFWNSFNYIFSQLNTLEARLINELKNGNKFYLNISETVINQILSLIGPLSSRNLLTLERTSNAMTSGKGTFYGVNLCPSPDLAPLLFDSHFKLANSS